MCLLLCLWAPDKPSLDTVHVVGAAAAVAEWCEQEQSQTLKVGQALRCNDNDMLCFAIVVMVGRQSKFDQIKPKTASPLSCTV